MINLLAIYGISIAATAVFAAGLAAIGAHIAQRNQAVQTLCLSQGALLGVLVGIGLTYAAGLSGTLSDALPVLFGNLCAAVTVFICSKLTAKHPATKSTLLVACFVLLLALSHLVTALLPGIETHMSQRYFGDLATMSDYASMVLLVLGGLLLAFLAYLTPRLLRSSFDEALSGDHGRHGDVFTWITVITVAGSVQLAGVLFTALCLFVPTTCMVFSPTAGARRHIKWCMLIAATGSAAGFFLALAASSMPTVPTIAVIMTLFGGTVAMVKGKPSSDM